MTTAIKAENISKQYRLGYVGSGSLKDDARRWWARMRGKEDPLLTIGETNDRSIKGESDYVWALKDINFEIEQGDTVGIIGRNGAGKSTLLKILSKVTAPTTGNIKVKGRIASLLEVGTGFHGELTGRENIYLNGAIMGMRKHEITRKLDEIVDFAGVERYLDTPVKRYSSGMYVRLGFAVAAHLENEILIVDEVLAVGDAEFQKKCLGKMGDLSKLEGRTVIFVSHSIPSIQNLCSRGILMDKGIVKSNLLTINQVITTYLKEPDNLNNVIIHERKDRKGTGKLRFTSYKLIDGNNNEINSLISGQEVTIRLFYELPDKVELVNVSVAISIKSSNGSVVSVFCNDYVDKVFNIVNSIGCFDCIIKKLPLMEDTYRLNIMANNANEIFDWVEDAINVKVENGDYFNTGKLIENTHKSFLIEHNWNLR